MTILSDLNSLWRRWRARPALPGLALLVLVTGVSAGATVIGVTYAALLRPLPYPSPDRLVLVRSEFPGMKLTGMGLSGPEASELADLTRSLPAVGFGYRSAAIVTIAAEPVRGDVVYASSGFVRALAATPEEGRVFTGDEDAPGGPCRAIISRRFRDVSLGPDMGAIGRLIRVDDDLCEIVGVWPARVDFAGSPADVWVPLHYDVRSPSSNRANHAFTVVARIGPEQTIASARADLARAVEGWIKATGQMHSPSTKFHPLTLTPLVDAIRGPVRATAIVLLLSVVTVLVITIANASALLVADVDRRRSELVVRAALGADRRRLWLMHAVEAGVLSTIAGVLGAIAALAGAEVISALAPPALANLDLSLPIWQTAAIAGLIAAATALVCSLFQSSRMPWQHLGSALADDGRTGTASGSRQRLRAWLVGTEIALAVALFTGATFMIETVWHLAHVDLGFRPDGVIRAQVNLPESGYDNRARIDAFYDAVAAALRARGDVVAVGAVTGLLPERRPNNTSITINGAASLDPHMGLPPIQFVQYLTPDAFAALGLELRRGRLITAADMAGAQPVVVLNERAAATYFAGRDAIGGQLRPMGPGFQWLTVVGIVGDARQNGIVRDPGTEMFVPLSQADGALGRGSFTRNLNIVARVREGDPSSLGPTLRDAVRAADPSAAISEIETLVTVVTRGIAGQRFLMFVLAGFAAVAVVLAMIGVYGVISHAVTLRGREIGLRRSLGASHWAVSRLVLRQVSALVTGGLVAGIMMAFGGIRLLAPFSFQTDAVSPARFAIAGAGIAILALLASARPLQRAIRVDPAIALRD